MAEKISFFKIGKIVKTQGLKGEFRVYPSSSNLERYFDLDFFYLAEDKETRYEVENVRQISPSLFVFKVRGYDSIESIESFINKNIYVSRDEAFELEEGEYYIADMIGLNVYDIEDKYIGKLADVLIYAANDVYVVKSEEGREFLIPAVKKYVPLIDLDNNKMLINPIKGMVD